MRRKREQKRFSNRMHYDRCIMIKTVNKNYYISVSNIFFCFKAYNSTKRRQSKNIEIRKKKLRKNAKLQIISWYGFFLLVRGDYEMIFANRQVIPITFEICNIF